MTDFKVLRKARAMGLVAMQPTGQWGLTEEARQLLDVFDLLRELDDRPGRAQEAAPTRPRPRPRSKHRPGDDGQPARRGAGKA